MCLFFIIVHFFPPCILFLCFHLAGEVPVTKLAALQKVLQSDFLSSVREVYEHVYETVDIQGSQVQFLPNYG